MRHNALFRRGAALLALLLLLAALGGCAAQDNSAAPADGRLRVVATIFPPYDFARQLGGDRVDAVMLAAPGTEAHDFIPSLADMETIAGCDLFLYVGGSMDAWVAQVLDSLGDRAPRALAISSLVATVTEELPAGAEDHEEHDGHDGEDEIDEHVWTSPQNAIAICRGIAAELAALDPAHQADYEARLTDYCAQLQTLDDTFHEVMAQSVRQTVVFAERFPFRYLADELGLTCYAAFAGCSSDTEPSLATVARLTSVVEAQQLPVVFYLEFSDQTLADTICQATGAQKRMLHSCHNVSPEDFAAGVTYLQLMQQNIANLRAALQ